MAGTGTLRFPRLTDSMRVKPRQPALPHMFLRSDRFSSDSPVTGGGFLVLPLGKELSLGTYLLGLFP